MRNLFLRYCALFFLLVSASYAIIDIESDYVQLDLQAKQFTVSENVFLSYFNKDKVFQIQSNKIKYSYEKKQLEFLDRFYLSTKNVLLDIDSITLDIDTNALKGKGLNFSSPEFVFKSKEFQKNLNLAQFDNCEFSSCTSLHHFKLSSRRCYLYSKLNVLVSFGNKLHIAGLPFNVPIPIAVMGLRQSNQKSVLPLIGKSVAEGRYIKQNIPYFLSRRSAGDIQLAYAEELGAVLGVENTFRLTAHQEFEGGYRLIEKQENAWFFEYTYLSEKFKNASIMSLIPFYDSQTKWGQTLTLSYYERQLIQDVFVNFKPKISLTNVYENQYKKGLAVLQELVFAKQEEFFGFGHGEMDTFQLNHSFDYRFLKSFYQFQPFLVHRYYYYDHSADWQRFYVGSRLMFETFFLKPELRVVYMLYSQGENLFAFEDPQAIKEHEIGLSTSYELGKFVLAMNIDYQLQSKDFRVLEYQLTRFFHCWNLSFSWDATDDSLSFKVSL